MTAPLEIDVVGLATIPQRLRRRVQTAAGQVSSLWWGVDRRP